MNSLDYKKELEEALSRYGSISSWSEDGVVYFVFSTSPKDAWEVAFSKEYYSPAAAIKMVLDKLDSENEKAPATS